MNFYFSIFQQPCTTAYLLFKLLFENVFIEDWPNCFLDSKWLVECDDSLCFLFPLLLAFF